ncbi:hypothetical protein IIA79_06285 [bacterium]|nr:hypothetical protein [bacterium]
MEDLGGTYEAVLFPQAYERFAPLTHSAGPFMIAGKVEEQFGTLTLNADYLRQLLAPLR